MSGEFINVGILLHARESGYLDVKVRRTLGRLSKAFPGVQKAAVTTALKAVERGVAKVRERISNAGLFADASLDAGQLAAMVLPSDDSSYVWSSLHSGVSPSPTEALQKAYERFVTYFDDEPRQGRDDAAVWQPVKELLTARNMIDRLSAKVISSPIDEVEFDHAWENGKWHCYQPLSFDLSTAEGIRDKAARWSGHMTGLSQATEELQPYFIVGAPSNPEHARDFEKAVKLLKASPLEPKVFAESESEVLADLITSQMQSAH